MRHLVQFHIPSLADSRDLVLLLLLHLPQGEFLCLKRQFFTAGVTFQLQTHLEMRPAYVHLKLRLFGVIPGDLLDPGLPERLFPIRSLLYGSFSLTCLNFGGCAQCVRNLQIDQLHFADQRVQVLLDASNVPQET